MKKKLILLNLFLLATLPIFAQDIFTAIQSKDVAAVKYLLNKDINVNARNSEGNTPLMEAVKSGQERVVKLLLQKDVNVDLKDKIRQYLP